MKIKLFGMLALLSVGLIYLGMPRVSDASVDSSRSNVDPVKVGEEAPDFTLKALSGESVTLSEARGKMPTVLVFYRGFWCPYCAKQLSELRFLLKKDEPVRLFAVSVDTQDQAKQLIDKITADGKGAIYYSFLSDPGHKTIDEYGLHDPTYNGKKFDGIPHASVYVIDKAGRVAWAKISDDYKVRPTNADIRSALDSLK
ncbi:MAG: peroxiredoxin family protein [Pyrinomonadaceae bacterium]